MNFAIMFTAEDGTKVIKSFDTLDEAQNTANNYACMGFAVTVFDWDMESKQFLEFYTV